MASYETGLVSARNYAALVPAILISEKLSGPALVNAIFKINERVALLLAGRYGKCTCVDFFYLPWSNGLIIDPILCVKLPCLFSTFDNFVQLKT